MDESIEIDPAIAAAMGFSSFGGAPKPAGSSSSSSKKRKLHAADQTSTSFSTTSSARLGSRPRGTGANHAPLGVRRPPVSSSALLPPTTDAPDANTAAGPGPGTESASAAPTAGMQDPAAAAQSEAPVHSTPRPARMKTKKSNLAAGGLAAFLSHAKTLPARPDGGSTAAGMRATATATTTTTTTTTTAPPVFATADATAPPADEEGPVPPGNSLAGPERGSASAPGAGGEAAPGLQGHLLPYPARDGGMQHSAQGHADRQRYRVDEAGTRNEHGDVAFFLPSFVEDPWADLRRHRGLVS